MANANSRVSDQPSRSQLSLHFSLYKFPRVRSVLTKKRKLWSYDKDAYGIFSHSLVQGILRCFLHCSACKCLLNQIDLTRAYALLLQKSDEVVKEIKSLWG